MQTNSSLSSTDTANAAHRGVDSAGAALHSGIDKMSEPACQIVDRLSTAAHGTVEKMADSVADAAERFSDKARCVTDAPSKALACSKSWIEDRPLQAVGAALAFGFLVGRLTGR